jgi:hypothetical protein
MVRRVLEPYPDARTIHLVLDHLNTHREQALIEHFGPVEGVRHWARLTVHCTPKHGRWLNQAEIELSPVSRQCLGAQRIDQLRAFHRQIRPWTTRANRLRTTITWRVTRKDARRTFGYLSHFPSGRGTIARRTGAECCSPP